jgi:3-hydroxyacyl-[acyl-carrier-protein] dehydratase
MRFKLLDTILDQSSDRIVAIKQVSLAEEYLADHFPTFPVLPGVLMVETMVQAARQMLADRGDPRLVLGEVRALKFGSFVRPGEALEVEVTVSKTLEDGAFLCRGSGRVRRHWAGSRDETAVSGRFTMRPIRSAMAAAPPSG